MSKYPSAIDDDSTLPPVNDNLDDIGGEAINDLREAVINIEQFVGTGMPGQLPLAARIGVIVNPQGMLNASVITSLGLVTLPIYNVQIAEAAGIQESKLQLDYPTNNLFNYIRDLAKDVNLSLGWIATEGVKLDPHLIGAIYRHDMTQIDVIENTALYLNNVFRTNRDNTSAYSLANDMNNELLAHQWADGSAILDIQNIITNSGAAYASNYAHPASGVYLDSAGFAIIPQTVQDVQAFADYMDSASVLTLGTRIQNLYANGVSVNSRSSNLNIDGYGAPVVPITPAIAYLGGQFGADNYPVDGIAYGDDMVQLVPVSNDGYSFDEQFAQVRTGDIIRISYAGDGYNVEIPFVVSEKKFIQNTNPPNLYYIRIAGKNIAYAPNATVRIDRSLFNNNKYGVLSVASGLPTDPNGNSLISGTTPSLIVGAPRGAQCTGVGFSPDQFNETHYLLYLILYPDGNPLDGYTILPGIDITGNAGSTPGSYTLNSIVAATNNAFRQPGFNYRFTAFQFQGEFGIMLADSYNNVSFSVVSAAVIAGSYNQAATVLSYPNNVIDVFPASGGVAQAPDPLGFGPFGAGLASPPFMMSYDSSPSAVFPTQLFTPLKRNNYYVNGAERETLGQDVMQSLDEYGDGYWTASVVDYVQNSNSISVTYSVPLDLQSSQLKAGKTLVIQANANNFGLINYGRFVIQSVVYSGCPTTDTLITVLDGYHAAGGSPVPIVSDGVAAPIGSLVDIYFDADSVSFDGESSTDFSSINGGNNFKRHFEVYIDLNGDTYTHERARISIVDGNITVNGITVVGSLTVGKFDIVSVSPKLRGYQFSTVNKIQFYITEFNSGGDGTFTGYLWDGTHVYTQGPTTTGKVGEVVRFYDETNIDYIDVIYEFTNLALPSFTDNFLDFQLFPSLASDQEIMILASCQERTDNFTISQIQDLREFGNTSEEQFTTSALNYISAGDRVLHFNGVIRGFDTTVEGSYPYSPTNTAQAGLLFITGGLALVDGNLEAINDQIFTIPPVKEYYSGHYYPINFALCANSEGELVTVVLTDYDSINATPNAPNRIVTVQNLVTGNTYQVDSNTFSYILNNRKDLTLLHIVTSVVGGSIPTPTVTLTTRDVRRFVNDSDSSIPAVVSSSQGNFQGLAVAANWLLFNGTYQNTIQIKGSHPLHSTDILPAGVQIVGGSNNAQITISSSQSISDVVFDNVNISVSGAFGVSNATFSNLDINVSALISVNIDNATGPVLFENCTITTTIPTAFLIGSNVTFNNCIFNYNYDPVASSDSNYIQGTYQLINVGTGNTAIALISIDMNDLTTVSNIQITECDFIWQPQSNSAVINRYPFVAALYSAFGQSLSNVTISNNTVSSNFPGQIDSLGAVVFIDTYHGSSPASGQAPQLVNCKVSSNLCDTNQMIAITAFRNSTNNNTLPAVINSAINCIDVIFDSNSFGTLSTTNFADLTYNSYGNAATKNYGIIASNNACIYIGTLDGSGQEIYSGGGTYGLKSGNIDINNNNCSWIRVGYIVEGNWPVNLASEITVFSNNLIANNQNLKNLYRAGNSPSHAIAVTSAQGAFFAEAVIDGNVVTYGNQGINVNGPNALGSYPLQYYGYTEDAIYANVNGVVTNNIITGYAIDGIYLNNANAVVTGNKIYRGNHNVSSYVNANGSGIHSVTDNFFDGSTVDGSNQAVIIGMSPAGTYTRNKNQICYAPLVLNDNTFGIAPNFLGIPGGTQNQLIPGASSTLPTNVWISHGVPSVIGSESDNAFNNITLSFNLVTAITEVGIQVDLGSRLPDGVIIQAIKLGVVTLSGNSYSGVGTFVVSATASSQDTNFSNISFATGTNTILDPNWGSLAANVDNTQQSNTLSWTLTGANNHNVTQYLTINIAGGDQSDFITSRTKSIVFSMLTGMTLSAGQQDITFSPLVIQYVW